MDPFVEIVSALNARGVRFVLIGVGGANFWADSGGLVFRTEDQDLFLPLEAQNLVEAWAVCERLGFELSAGPEPLDTPRDIWLAERVTAHRTLTRATHPSGLVVDLTLIMAGFDFETVWQERRTFSIGEQELPVATLLHIVSSKVAAGRDKDKLFLATHKDALEQLLNRRT